MCGFSGFISCSNPLDITLLEKSLYSIKHRGPDDSLIYNLENNKFLSTNFSSIEIKEKHKTNVGTIKSNMAIGFNRLSILDLSIDAMQPFADEKTQTSFIFNGEIYNYRELKDKYLYEENFISNSDSEVAYKLYLKFGENFVQYLQGMFSIVIIDKKEKKLKAWRDRMGMKPLYYAFVNDIFVFGSEAKCLFEFSVFDKKENIQGLAYSMYLGTCPSPLTIYQNIYTLPAASYLCFDIENKNIDIKRYWTLEYKPTDIENDLEKWLRNTVKLHITGEVKKGLMQSGGLDSGLLAFFLGDTEPQNIAYNIFAENHKINESDFAEINAKHANLKFEKIEIKKNISSALRDEFLACEEEPNKEPEPTYFICKEVHKNGTKVLYNALGLDELFGGYEYFYKSKQLEKIFPIINKIPTFLIPKKYREKAKTLIKYGSFVYPFISRQLFSWGEIKKYFSNSDLKSIPHPIEYILEDANKILPNFNSIPLLKKISWLEFHYYISSHHSFRSDQPSMKNSIEVRFPFLDHNFIQTFFNEINTFDNIDNGLKPKVYKIANKLLDSKIIDMPKKGFSMPTENWLPTNGDIKDVSKKWYLMSLEKIFNKS